MTQEPGNPYAPGHAGSPHSISWALRVAIATFFLVASIPTVTMLFWLIEHFVALYSEPTKSYRPILAAVGLGFALVTAIVGYPIAFLLRRFCNDAKWQFLDLFPLLASFPFLLGFIGPFIIAWITGSSFGS